MLAPCSARRRPQQRKRVPPAARRLMRHDGHRDDSGKAGWIVGRAHTGTMRAAPAAGHRVSVSDKFPDTFASGPNDRDKAARVGVLTDAIDVRDNDGGCGLAV